jgi:predicted amidophosphoribosyltransferase
MASKCPTCGKAARPTHKFCGACGRPLPKAPNKEEPLVCTDCGAELDDESVRFCTNCGSEFEN